MGLEITPTEKIKYEFTVKNNELIYQGTYEFTLEEWENITYEEIDMMIVEEFQKWKDYITMPIGSR